MMTAICGGCDGSGQAPPPYLSGPCTDCGGSGEWRPYLPCPCGCGVKTAKLTKSGHSLLCGSKNHGATKDCKTKSCTRKRGRSKGRRVQADGHRRLGGQGMSPMNEEWIEGYPIRALSLVVKPEMKGGEQVPVAVRGLFDHLEAVLGLDWTRKAMRQSERGLAVGSPAFEGLYVQPPGSATAYLLVRIPAGVGNDALRGS